MYRLCLSNEDEGIYGNFKLSSKNWKMTFNGKHTYNDGEEVEVKMKVEMESVRDGMQVLTATCIEGKTLDFIQVWNDMKMKCKAA